MKQKRTNATTKRPIESYEHSDKQRVNNPPYGIRYGSNFQPFVNQRNLMNRRKA